MDRLDRRVGRVWVGQILREDEVMENLLEENRG